MTYIIAELGSVHEGSVGNACRLIHECALLGADAVKLQDHRGEKVKGDPPWFKGREHEKRGDYLKRTSFDQDQWARVRMSAWEACRLGSGNTHVDLVVSPFSVEAVELQEALRLPGELQLAYKIASGQVTNHEMLRAIRATGRRVFLSSGMSTEEEDEVAYDILAPIGSGNWVTRMICTSSYPCPPESVGLNRVVDMAGVGLSDHTLGFAASLAAIALGATVIERHVTFHRGMYGTDAMNSLTLEEFGRFVKEVRDLDVMLANPVDKDSLARSPEMLRMREAFLEQP